MQQFKGAFELVEKYSVKTDGTVIHPWGKEVRGLLIYTDTYVSAQLGVKNRTKLSVSNFRQAEAEEAQSAFTSYIAYFGEYDVKETYITHNIKQSLFPNWTGLKVKRYYRFEEDLLYLEAKEVAVTSGLEKTVLVWKRLQ